MSVNFDVFSISHTVLCSAFHTIEMKAYIFLRVFSGSAICCYQNRWRKKLHMHV